MAYYQRPLVEYWQDNETGKVFQSAFMPGDKPSEEWLHMCRKVRLWHDPGNSTLVVSPFDSEHDVLLDELDLDEYNYLKLVYSNPDI